MLLADRQMSPFTHTWPISKFPMENAREEIPKLCLQNFYDRFLNLIERDKLFHAPKNINYLIICYDSLHTFILFPLRYAGIIFSVNFLLLYRRELSSDCISLILKRSILVCHEIRRPTGVLELHFGDGERMKRALGVVRDPSRAATALHGFLIFISCNIYRSAIAVRQGKVAGSERLRDIRWLETEMQIDGRINAPLNDRLGISLDLFLHFVKWKFLSISFQVIHLKYLKLYRSYAREGSLKFIIKGRRDKLTRKWKLVSSEWSLWSIMY